MWGRQRRDRRETAGTSLSSLTRASSSTMMGCRGLTSIVFLDTRCWARDGSAKACDFMMRSMLALYPYWDVVRMHGVDARRDEMATFST